jgi:hypothetical protein
MLSLCTIASASAAEYPELNIDLPSDSCVRQFVDMFFDNRPVEKAASTPQESTAQKDLRNRSNESGVNCVSIAIPDKSVTLIARDSTGGQYELIIDAFAYDCACQFVDIFPNNKSILNFVATVSRNECALHIGVFLNEIATFDRDFLNDMQASLQEFNEYPSEQQNAINLRLYGEGTLSNIYRFVLSGGFHATGYFLKKLLHVCRKHASTPSDTQETCGESPFGPLIPAVCAD